ncbi:hypothetical protein, partial [Haematobacter genomosp. 1]
MIPRGEHGVNDHGIARRRADQCGWDIRPERRLDKIEEFSTMPVGPKTAIAAVAAIGAGQTTVALWQRSSLNCRRVWRRLILVS